MKRFNELYESIIVEGKVATTVDEFKKIIKTKCPLAPIMAKRFNAARSYIFNDEGVMGIVFNDIKRMLRLTDDEVAEKFISISKSARTAFIKEKGISEDDYEDSIRKLSFKCQVLNWFITDTKKFSKQLASKLEKEYGKGWIGLKFAMYYFDGSHDRDLEYREDIEQVKSFWHKPEDIHQIAWRGRDDRSSNEIWQTFDKESEGMTSQI